MQNADMNNNLLKGNHVGTFSTTFQEKQKTVFLYSFMSVVYTYTIDIGTF